MKPPGKIRKPPDIVRLVQDKPELVAVTYGGKVYRWRPCSQCERRFWKSTSEQGFRNGLKRVYCSTECQSEGYRLLNNERQARWKKNQR